MKTFGGLIIASAAITATAAFYYGDFVTGFAMLFAAVAVMFSVGSM